MIAALVHEIATPAFAIAAVAIAAAGIVKGFAGFGVAMVGGPVLAVLYSPVEAIATILALELVTAAQLVPRALARAEWPIVAPLVLASWLTVPIGSYFLVAFDPLLVRRAIAATAFLFALVMLAGARYRGRQSLPISLGIGVGSGVITGSPVALSRAPDELDVCARGTDGAFWHAVRGGAEWNPWELLGGNFIGSPSAISRGRNLVDVVGRGTDKSAWHIEWDGTRWKSPTYVGGSF